MGSQNLSHLKSKKLETIHRDNSKYRDYNQTDKEKDTGKSGLPEG